MSRIGGKNLLNTTQKSFGFNLLYFRQVVSSHPNSGGFHPHKEKALELLARVENDNSNFTVENINKYLESCKSHIERQQSLPEAHITNKNRSFFRAVLYGMGGFFGIGLSDVQETLPVWQRPDRSTPGKCKSKTNFRPSSPSANILELRNSAFKIQQLNNAQNHISGVQEILTNELARVEGNLGNYSSAANSNLSAALPNVSALKEALKTLDGFQNTLNVSHSHADKSKSIDISDPAKRQALLNKPPGFQTDAEYSLLTAPLKALELQLNKRKAAGGNEWPITETLELVSRSLSQSCRGDAKLAAATLNQLMASRFIELVPLPGRWLDGSAIRPGYPPPACSYLENLIRDLIQLPCGTELMTRLVLQEPAAPTLEQRNAVLVYHRATVQITSNHRIDSASLMMLRRAANSASRILHTPIEELNLSVPELSAFHGVRNGLISVALDSPWFEANQQLLRLAQKSERGISQTSPLQMSSAAAVAATLVNLPTPIKKINNEMAVMCARLKEIIDNIITQNSHSHKIDTETIQSLKTAIGILENISNQADQYPQACLMKIKRKAWRNLARTTQPKLLCNASKVSFSKPNENPPDPFNNLRENQSKPVNLKDRLVRLYSDKATTLDALKDINECIASLISDHSLQLITQQKNAKKTPSQYLELNKASLENISTHESTMKAVMGAKENLDIAEWKKWMVSSLGNKSCSVTMKFGRSLGVNTCGISGTFRQITSLVGITARLDAEYSQTKQQVVKYAKQSRGLELFVGDYKQYNKSYGLGGGVRWGLLTLPSGDGISTSATVNWLKTHSRSEAQGVLLRSPVYGDREIDIAREDFSNMMDSALQWRELKDLQTHESYSSPIEAILCRHPNASVGTIDRLINITNTTTTGISVAATGGGPFAQSTLKRFFGSLSLGVGLSSTRQNESVDYKTRAGSQGFAGTTTSSTATVNFQARATGHLGGLLGPNLEDSAQARSSWATYQRDLLRMHKQSAATLVRQPDGSLTGEKSQDFNLFQQFYTTVQPRWDEWVEHGVKRKDWPASTPNATKRLLVEQELKSFMSAAADSALNGGTVTLSETLEVRPEVCAEINAYLALEEVAQSQGRYEQASEMLARRQQLLSSESSYRPYKLKAIVQSSEDTSLGFNTAFSWLRKKSAAAAHEYDSYP